ncbi:hypothetical protein EDC01DRAFT_636933 [Geopyxis carbonaria]|nr:hypothetical protein EDC01DRAFT_636933 [Geopyxis carbonaria]
MPPSSNDPATTGASSGPAVWIPRRDKDGRLVTGPPIPAKRQSSSIPHGTQIKEFHQRPSDINTAGVPFMSAPKGWQPPPPGTKYGSPSEKWRNTPGSGPLDSSFFVPNKTSGTPYGSPIGSNKASGTPYGSPFSTTSSYTSSAPRGMPAQAFVAHGRKLKEQVDKFKDPEEIAREKIEHEELIAQGLAKGAGSWWVDGAVKPPYTAAQKAEGLRMIAEQERAQEERRRHAYREREEASEEEDTFDYKAAHKKYTQHNAASNRFRDD